MKIVENLLKPTEYYKEETTKRIAVLHHTSSGPGVEGDIAWWNQDKRVVGTSYIVPRDGNYVVRTVPDKYWLHHLGIPSKMFPAYKSNTNNEVLNKISIGIEIDSWGGLTKKGDKFFSYTGKEVDSRNVIEYPSPYRNYKYFEKYTDSQIEQVRLLLLDLNERLGIPLYYFPEMFEVNSRALKGYHGIWTHTSFVHHKSDCHPQKNLIEMLKEICTTK